MSATTNQGTHRQPDKHSLVFPQFIHTSRSCLRSMGPDDHACSAMRRSQSVVHVQDIRSLVYTPAQGESQVHQSQKSHDRSRRRLLM